MLVILYQNSTMPIAKFNQRIAHFLSCSHDSSTHTQLKRNLNDNATQIHATNNTKKKLEATRRRFVTTSFPHTTQTSRVDAREYRIGY